MLPVVCSEEVAKLPVAEFGDSETTNAGSVAVGAVDAAFTAAVFVPSVTRVVCVLLVRLVSFVSIDESDVLPVVWFAAVATPVNFVSIELKEVFPVVWLAAVATPVNLVSMDEREVFPVVCNAEVEAPVGSAEDVTVLSTVSAPDGFTFTFTKDGVGPPPVLSPVITDLDNDARLVCVRV